ncbi:MAG: SUF system Fe-S cluster assembly regulator [Acidobacteriota bacterium]
MLRMTKQADYGIVLMSHLAEDLDRLKTAGQLADATQLPVPMVQKILKLLVKGQLLTSHRGAHGGYQLAKVPADIPLVEMIEALEGPIGLVECSDSSPGQCSLEASCRIRSTWRRIDAAVRDALIAITLADLAPGVLPPLIQLSVRPENNLTTS